MTVTTASDTTTTADRSTTATDAHAEEAIAAGRARIDELDAEIVALVQQRLQVSHGIQRVRMAAGGRRVEHGREIEIVNRYAAALGQPGADLALAILHLSRGGDLPRQVG